MKPPKRRRVEDPTTPPPCSCEKPSKSGAIMCRLHRVYVPGAWPEGARRSFHDPPSSSAGSSPGVHNQNDE